jgi:hypothetical protein
MWLMIREYGYEYDATLNEELWKKTEGCVTYEKLWNAICLRSGRDTLKAIAREYEPTVVYIPALSCDSMVLPFEMYGHKVEYYRLNDDYTIDQVYLQKLFQDHTRTILFLYIDYFGITAINDSDLQSLKERYPNLIFIEDRTHNLIWDRMRKFASDYTMASLRKWVNIPDGGLLWTKHELKNNVFSEDTSFSATRLQAQCMRHEFFETGDQNLKSEYRKIFSSVSDIMDEDKEPSRMSAYSYEIAAKTDWNNVRSQRKSNAEKLISVLKQADVKFIQNKVGLSDLYVTFLVEYREQKQSKLSAMGIFNTIIWPLNDEQKEICNTAKRTEEYMLAAPCDQRYSIKDMEYIGSEIVKIVNS